MTAKARPRWKESHWVRNASIAVIAVFVGLAVIGVLQNRPTDFVPPPGQATPASSDEVLPTDTPVPTSGAEVLLTMSGTSGARSEPFPASGESVDVAYDYACTEFAGFAINFYGTASSPLLPDILVQSESGATDSAISTENLNGAAGPFRVEVVSDCTWSLKVLGAH